jgi:hypothetical protein
MSAHRECRDGDAKPRHAKQPMKYVNAHQAREARVLPERRGYEDGERPRLECRAEPGGAYCGCEFPVPAGVEIKWV